ncbi:MAG: N-acetylmuramoyl-L-alanine amidase [Spirochaetaceae bacterium]|jgi:N-acetylmuramoyl-L-alanine amidase|nr:N-acetylmuramoyl-L-alanine amidase [Spirochaetaceae bacterium]
MNDYQYHFLSINRFSRPGTPLRAVRGIVIHWVGNPGTSAKANRNYFENLKTQNPDDKNARYASAHFIVGLDGEIIRCIPENEIAYHVGAQKYNALALNALNTTYPNNSTIGIELCHPDRTGKFEKETLAAARELIQQLIKQFGIPRGNIFRHFDITGKDCPRYFVQNEDAWNDFRESVYAD